MVADVNETDKENCSADSTEVTATVRRVFWLFHIGSKVRKDFFLLDNITDDMLTGTEAAARHDLHRGADRHPCPVSHHPPSLPLPHPQGLQTWKRQHSKPNLPKSLPYRLHPHSHLSATRHSVDHDSQQSACLPSHEVRKFLRILRRLSLPHHPRSRQVQIQSRG